MEDLVLNHGWKNYYRIVFHWQQVLCSHLAMGNVESLVSPLKFPLQEVEHKQSTCQPTYSDV